MGRTGIEGQTLAFPGSEKKQSLPVLRNTIVGGIQDFVVFQHAVAVHNKGFDNLGKESLVLAYREPTYILEHKKFGFKFGNDSNEMMHQTVSWIVKSTLPNHAEALARRPTKNDVYVSLAEQ